MTRTTCLLAIAISVSMFATGCPAADDGVALPPPRDGGDSATDSSSESGGDVADADVAETDAGCTAGDLQKRACGKCGTQIRTCASGVWKDWLACEGELATAECAIDETRNSPCGNCGMQKDTCDPTACTWSAGSCTGEGPCAAGDSETTTASCTTAGEIRTRTCSDKCMWSAFSACELPRRAGRHHR